MANEGKPQLQILQGSFFLKMLVLIGVVLIISVFLFAIPLTLPDLVWTALKIAAGVFLIYLVFEGIKSKLNPKEVSPTESFRRKVIRVAKLSKPFNLKQLYLRGEDMRVYSYWGKVTGLCFIPYHASVIEKDEDGKPIMVDAVNRYGVPIKDAKGAIVKVPKRKLLDDKDGDWCFVTKIGFWIFGKEELVRAHYSYCSEIGEKVWIKTPNVVPIGDYYYPSQQWQTDIVQILEQHKSEAIIETHEQLLDLVAHVTKMSLGGDPTFQKIMLAQSESISANNAGFLMRPPQ